MPLIQGNAKSADAGDFYDTEISQSLRFNDDDNAYLSRTPASAGNRKTWTWSGWVKGGDWSSLYGLFGVGGASSTPRGYFYLGSNTIGFYSDPTGSSVTAVGDALPIVYRDSAAWYHFVVQYDTTQATASDRIRFYVNGELLSGLIFSYPAQNEDGVFNTTNTHYIGAIANAAYPYNGYLSEVHFIDGTALDASSFGETKSGVWIPKAYSGSYGTNGFYLDFGNSGSIGADVSGNGNNFTANNLAATDVVLDSPTNNFATWNVLANINGDTFSEGNLKVSTAASPYSYTPSSIGTSSSKVYSEFYISSTSSADMFGIVTGASSSTTTYIGQSSEAWGYRGWTGQVVNGGTVSSYGNTFTTGDIVGIAVDLDNGYVYWSINGTWQNSADPTSGASGTGGKDISSISGKDIFFAYSDFDTSATPAVYIGNFGQDSSFAGNKTAQGNTDDNGYGDFYYAPPTGYLALCTANLPDPVESIDPAQDGSPQDHFNTVLYSGDSTSSNAITGVGFQPDLVWIKERNGTFNHVVQDSVRGIGTNSYLYIATDNTDAETSQTDGDGLLSLDTDGFTVGFNNTGAWNETGSTYASWNWKANGSGVSNTDGSITSTVSANTDAGFSIVSYTGTGANATVGHGLNSAPEMIIVKNRDTAYNWVVYSESIPNTQYLVFNSTQAVDTFPMWNNTSPTSSVVNLGSFAWINALNEDHIAYCFHSVDGFSKFGSYIGNGSSDGSFIYTGFTPAWVLFKRSDLAGEWFIYDSTRDTVQPIDSWLWAHSSNAETTSSSYDVDFLSNGFKMRYSSTINSSGYTYIYMAFAENPFKYANAR